MSRSRILATEFRCRGLNFELVVLNAKDMKIEIYWIDEAPQPFLGYLLRGGIRAEGYARQVLEELDTGHGTYRADLHKAATVALAKAIAKDPLTRDSLKWHQAAERADFLS